jgi:hypothetical protein
VTDKLHPADTAAFNKSGTAGSSLIAYYCRVALIAGALLIRFVFSKSFCIHCCALSALSSALNSPLDRECWESEIQTDCAVYVALICAFNESEKYLPQIFTLVI